MSDTNKREYAVSFEDFGIVKNYIDKRDSDVRKYADSDKRVIIDEFECKPSGHRVVLEGHTVEEVESKVKEIHGNTVHVNGKPVDPDTNPDVPVNPDEGGEVDPDPPVVDPDPDIPGELPTVPTSATYGENGENLLPVNFLEDGFEYNSDGSIYRFKGCVPHIFKNFQDDGNSRPYVLDTENGEASLIINGYCAFDATNSTNADKDSVGITCYIPFIPGNTYRIHISKDKSKEEQLTSCEPYAMINITLDDGSILRYYDYWGKTTGEGYKGFVFPDNAVSVSFGIGTFNGSANKATGYTYYNKDGVAWGYIQTPENTVTDLRLTPRITGVINTYNGHTPVPQSGLFNDVSLLNMEGETSDWNVETTVDGDGVVTINVLSEGTGDCLVMSNNYMPGDITNVTAIGYSGNDMTGTGATMFAHWEYNEPDWDDETSPFSGDRSTYCCDGRSISYIPKTTYISYNMNIGVRLTSGVKKVVFVPYVHSLYNRLSVFYTRPVSAASTFSLMTMALDDEPNIEVRHLKDAYFLKLQSADKYAENGAIRDEIFITTDGTKVGSPVRLREFDVIYPELNKLTRGSGLIDILATPENFSWDEELGLVKYTIPAENNSLYFTSAEDDSLASTSIVCDKFDVVSMDELKAKNKRGVALKQGVNNVIYFYNPDYGTDLESWMQFITDINEAVDENMKTFKAVVKLAEPYDVVCKFNKVDYTAFVDGSETVIHGDATDSTDGAHCKFVVERVKRVDNGALVSAMIDEFESEMNSSLEAMDSKIADCEASVAASISSAMTEIDGKIAEVDANVDSKITEFEEAMNTSLNEVRSDVTAELEAALNEIDGKINNSITKILTTGV